LDENIFSTHFDILDWPLEIALEFVDGIQFSSVEYQAVHFLKSFLKNWKPKIDHPTLWAQFLWKFSKENKKNLVSCLSNISLDTAGTCINGLQWNADKTAKLIKNISKKEDLSCSNSP